MSNKQKSSSYLYHEKLKKQMQQKYGIGHLSLHVIARFMTDEEITALVLRYKKHAMSKQYLPINNVNKVQVLQNYIDGQSTDDIAKNYQIPKSKVFQIVAEAAKETLSITR